MARQPKQVHIYLYRKKENHYAVSYTHLTLPTKLEV